MQRAVRTFLLRFLAPAGAWLLSAGVWAQPMPEIALDPAIECWYHSDFPMLTALVDPSGEIVNSRLYFRCSLYQDYYFVDLKTEGGAFTGVAPQAEESCPQVHYYVEAVTRDFTSARTPERIAEVTSHSECQRRNPAAAYFPSDNPEIVLGSTVAGPALAPGFKSVGVGAFMSSAGAVAGASSGGGSSATLIAGVAAGGAAAVGVGVLVAGSDTTTSQPAIMVAPPPPPPPPVTTIPPGPTIPPAAEVKACVRFEPLNAVVDVNEKLTIDGRCSEGGDGLTYHYDLGDGRVKEGQPFITVVYPVPGTYTMKLTVSRNGTTFRGAARQDEDTITRTVRVKQDLIADFDAYNFQIDTCSAEFDASDSEGQIDAYNWELDINNDFGEGVIRTNGKIVQHHWFSPGCFRAKGRMMTRLTVVGPDGAESSITKEVNVFGARPLQTNQTPTVDTSLTTHLMAPERTRAQVILGSGQAEPVSAGVPSLHRYRGALGRNTVEAVLVTPLQEPVMWRFDFTAAANFVPGSLRVVSGTVVSRDARSVVLRMTGRSGERARIQYELAR